MREPGRKTKYWISRVFALLLIVTLAAGLLPPGAFADNTDGGMQMPDSEKGTIRAYDWHRVNVVKDLPPAGTVCPVLILWQSNNTVYYATGGYAGQVDMGGRLADWDAVGSGSWSTGSADLPNPFAGNSTDIMTFRTWEKMTTWEMEVTGRTDGDNNNAPVVRFYPYSNCMITGYDDFDFDAKQPVSYSSDIKKAYDLWTLYTSELGGDGASGLPGGRVRIFDNVPGTDTCFKEQDGYLVGWCWESHAKFYGNFVMYWGEERNLSAITDDYTIAEGQVMNVDDGVVLMDGKKLTIEPGGMLSVEGTFYNNGYIENRGTMILQENACVRSSPDVNEAAGKILCSGAKVNRKDIAEEWIAVLEGQVDALKAERNLENSILELGKAIIEEYKKNVDANQAIVDAADYIRDQANLLGEEADIAKAEANTKDAEAATTETNAKDAEAKGNIEEAEKLRAEAERLKKEAEQLRAEAEQLKKEADAKREEYYKETCEAKKLLDEYISFQGKVADIENTIDALDESIDTLNEDIKGYSAVTDEWVSGDGNLLLLKGAKLALGDGAASGFRIESGANVTSHGYIISPHTVTLNSAKLEIGKNGVLFCGYTYPAKDMNLPQLEPKNPGTLNVTFSNLTAVKYSSYSEEGNALELHRDYTNKYIFEVDGVYRYSAKGAFQIMPMERGIVRSFYTDPNYGHGQWITYVDPNAPHDNPDNPDDPGSDGPINPGPYGPY